MLLKNRHQWPTFPFFLGSWETLSFSTHEKGKKAGWDEEKSYVSLPPIIVYATLGMGTGVLQAAVLGPGGSTPNTGMGRDAQRRPTVYPIGPSCGWLSGAGHLYTRSGF